MKTMTTRGDKEEREWCDKSKNNFPKLDKEKAFIACSKGTVKPMGNCINSFNLTVAQIKLINYKDNRKKNEFWLLYFHSFPPFCLRTIALHYLKILEKGMRLSSGKTYWIVFRSARAVQCPSVKVYWIFGDWKYIFKKNKKVHQHKSMDLQTQTIPTLVYLPPGIPTIQKGPGTRDT